MIWMNRSPIIPHSAGSASAMAWKSFDVSYGPASNDVKRSNWCGARSCTSTRRKSMPMRIWIRLPLVLRLRHEKLSKNIWLPFLRQNQESRRTLRQAPVTKGLPNNFPWTPLPHHHYRCPLSSPRHSARNLRETMRPDTTGWQRGGKQEREVHGTYQRTADLRISST